jgi:hypothetical protein
LLKSLFDDLFFAFFDVLSHYYANMVANLCRCGRARNRGFSAVAVQYLDKLIRTQPAATLQHLELLVDELTGLFADRAATFVMVQIVEKLIEISVQNDQLIERLLGLLGRVRDDGTNAACLCTAHVISFKTLIALDRMEECAEYVHQCLARYVQLDLTDHSGEWNELVLAFFHEFMKMKDDVFRIFIQKSVDVIAQLVECESSDVRRSLIDVLRRAIVFQKSDVV